MAMQAQRQQQRHEESMDEDLENVGPLMITKLEVLFITFFFIFKMENINFKSILIFVDFYTNNALENMHLQTESASIGVTFML